MSAEDEAGKALAALTRQLIGLQAAANATVGAASYARGEAGKARQVGFGRVAEGLAHLADRIDKLAAGLATAADQITPGQQAAAEVTAQSTPAQTRERLTATVGAIDTTYAAITEAVQETREIEDGTTRVLDGADPRPLLGMLKAVHIAANDAIEHGDAAKEHAQAGVTLSQQLGGGAGQPATTGGPASAGQTTARHQSDPGEPSSVRQERAEEEAVRPRQETSGWQARAVNEALELTPGGFGTFATITTALTTPNEWIVVGMSIGGYATEIVTRRVLKRLKSRREPR